LVHHYRLAKKEEKEVENEFGEEYIECKPKNPMFFPFLITAFPK